MRRMLRDVKMYIIHNWAIIAVGCILTIVAADETYQIRGYSAVGGEYLIIPIILIVKEMIADACLGIADILGTKDDGYEDEEE